MHIDESEVFHAYGALQFDGLVPLTAIGGYTDLLLRGAFGPLTPQQQEALSVIRQKVKAAVEVWRQGYDYMSGSYQELSITALRAHDFIGSVRERLGSPDTL